jgi:hypothetical protein
MAPTPVVSGGSPAPLLKSAGPSMRSMRSAPHEGSYLGMKGVARSSLLTMQRFCVFFSPQFEVVPQPVGQMSWGMCACLLGEVS